MEKPLCQRPRRLADWLNPDGQRKVHSLVDKVYQPKNLRAAWEKVKANRGSGGIDGQSLEAFEQGLDAHLGRLHEELRTDCYQPLPVRRVEIRDRHSVFRVSRSLIQDFLRELLEAIRKLLRSTPRDGNEEMKS